MEIWALLMFYLVAFIDHVEAKKNICLFPICCHFNQWVGRKFILFFIVTKSVGKNYFLVYLGPDSLPCMSYLYIT